MLAMSCAFLTSPTWANTKTLDGDEALYTLNLYGKTLGEVCIKNGAFEGNRAFVFEQKIIAGDSVPTNCGQAAVFYEQKVNELAPFVKESKNKIVKAEQANCTNCSQTQSILEKSSSEKQSCSIEQKEKLKQEPCSFSCFMASALSNSASLVPVVGGTLKLATQSLGNNSCPPQKEAGFWSKQKEGLKSAGSCAVKVLEGIKNNITDLGKSVATLGSAAWSAAKNTAKKTGQKIVSFFSTTKSIDQGTNDLAHAASQEKNQDLEKFKNDEQGWLKDKMTKAFAMVESVFKEITYMGKWERESECLNCQQKNLLKCEIVGRAAFDLFGYAAGAGLASNIAKKALPLVKGTLEASLKTIQTGAKSENVLFKTGANALLKSSEALNYTTKAGYTIVSYPAKKTLEGWDKFVQSSAFNTIREYAKSGAATVSEEIAKNAAKKGVTSLPGKVTITTAKIAKEATEKTGQAVASVFELEKKVYDLFAGNTGKKLATKGGASLEGTAAEKIQQLKAENKIEEATNVALSGEQKVNLTVIKTEERAASTVTKGAEEAQPITLLEGSSYNKKAMEEVEANLKLNEVSYKKTSHGEIEIFPNNACKTKISFDAR